MLTWDDFRVVKAIAERESLADAAVTLDIDEATVSQNLAWIEQRASESLFERDGQRCTPTPRGAEMVRLAERLAAEVGEFERRLHGTPGDGQNFVTGVVPIETIMARSGLEFL